MQSASGGNHGSRSWGEPPRPRCLPKTALHRYAMRYKGIPRWSPLIRGTLRLITVPHKS
ncbi:hypothetical protein [Moorena producens]|uniref:hypothetical protein n=1 Tax=Moorena producens TaxID=1155739 RepID=UPI001314450F|nr:hypothetical protein [Moorena producens]